MGASPTAAQKQAQLDALAAKFVTLKICPELAATATNLVMGEGNPDADVMFVGEAPGAKEDQTGRPFVGAAGRFLDELLASIRLERSKVFIGNIVKYRPPENRDPYPEEIAAFKPVLIQQIQIIQPKLIVFLGRHAMSVFLPELRISQVHGRVFRKDGQVYLPLYHPAAALYNGGMRQTLLKDFATIPVVIEQLS